MMGWETVERLWKMYSSTSDRLGSWTLARMDGIGVMDKVRMLG